jgi:hypothetical protein
MILTEKIAAHLQVDIDENHILCWKHDSGGTKDSGNEIKLSVPRPYVII